MSRAEDLPTYRRLEGRLRALEDALRLTWAVALLAAPAAALVLPGVAPRALDVALRVVVALAGQVLVLSALRQLLPPPPTGSFRVDERAYLTTLVSTTLAEVALWAPFRGPFWLLHATRVVYLRALGAEVAPSARIPTRISVRDPALLRVGASARLDDGVVIETLARRAGRVHVARVWIGKKAVVEHDALLSPGASVAHEGRVGPRAILREDARVGMGASVDARALVGARAEVGAYAIVGASAQVGDDARLGDRARVAAGAVVPDDARIAERAIFPEGATISRRTSMVSLRVVDG